MNGLQFEVSMEFDSESESEAPWDSECGHGVVSDWTARDKRPGERVLCRERGRCRFYDVQATIAIAREDGWGIDPERKAKWEAFQGRPLTAGQIAAAAVEHDFQWLRGWANNEWHYMGVIVTVLDIEGKPTHLSESVWGIESNDDQHLADIIAELKAELERQVGPANIIIESRPGRVTHYTVRPA